MTIVVESFDFTTSFRDALAAADAGLQQATREALELLKKNPRARSLRLHSLKSYPKPTIYKIDVYTNHSHQITFEMVGTQAILRRLGTHKELDRDPR